MTIRKSLRRCVSIAAIAGCCILAACGQSNDPQAQEFQRKIENAIGSGSSEVKINTLTDFDWDQVCHLARGDDSLDPPDIDRFVRARGLADGVSSKWWPKRENYNTAFVFSKGDAVVEIVRISSGGPHFLFNDRTSRECVPARSAVFEFEKRVVAGRETTVVNFKGEEN